MREERKVMTLNPREEDTLIVALNEKRNDLLEERKPTDDVDDVLLKVIDAPSRKFRVRDDEAR